MRLPIYITALKMAKILAADQSQDPFAKVGCAGIRKDKTLIFGFNGPPPGIELDWSNREEKNKRVIHAETNLLRYCKPGEIETVVCSYSPCINCLPQLAAYGIKTIYFEHKYERGTPFSEIEQIAREFNIQLIQINDTTI
jgi:deoxycytidylate deaminase